MSVFYSLPIFHSVTRNTIELKRGVLVNSNGVIEAVVESIEELTEEQQKNCRVVEMCNCFMLPGMFVCMIREMRSIGWLGVGLVLFALAWIVVFSFAFE